MHEPFLMTSRNGHVQRCKSRVTTHIYIYICTYKSCFLFSEKRAHIYNNHAFHTYPTLRSSYTCNNTPADAYTRTYCMHVSVHHLHLSFQTLATFVFLHVEGISSGCFFFPVLATPSVQFTLQLHPRSNQEPFGHFLQGRERPGRQEMHGVLVTCGEQ
jgi:hypothetical protein